MEEKCSQCPRGKLHSYNWLQDIPGGLAESEIVEIQFKNTRKGYYRNTLNLELNRGDIVAVEATPGHDIGTVTLTGRLVELQMRRAGIKPDADLKRIFRKAKPADIEKFNEARARENDTMIRARKIAETLNLNMKIGDVEYQGDAGKAIFYYIADERVDFRQLIKILADTFKVRIEMKQIGARQEAGRIGGIGSCGRPLCCASWMTNFVSVGTSAARYQDISLNPQKLAGQCGKLKCCLNFEIDTYVESSRHLPGKEIRLETTDATYYHFKTDIFKKEITYSTDKQIAANLITLPASRVFEIIELNRRGEKPTQLLTPEQQTAAAPQRPIDLASQDDLTRFDRAKKKRKKNKPNRPATTTERPQTPTTAERPATPQPPRPKPSRPAPQNNPGANGNTGSGNSGTPQKNKKTRRPQDKQPRPPQQTQSPQPAPQRTPKAFRGPGNNPNSNTNN